MANEGAEVYLWPGLRKQRLVHSSIVAVEQEEPAVQLAG